MNDSNGMKNILLSIVIPTYKRVKFLETIVTTLANQIKSAGLENLVQIIISDDASGDDTATYVKHADNEYGFVDGYVQEKNLGVSPNILWLIDKAIGPYVLICCDDDLLTDGALKYIIDCIREKKPNIILINTSNMMSLDDSNKKYEISLQNRLNITKDIFIEDFERDCNKLRDVNNWIHMTNLATAVVFKKDIFNKELETTRKYLKPKNVYIFQAPLLIGIGKYGKLLIIGQCFVLHRKNETNWTHNIPLDFWIDTFDPPEVAKIIKEYLPSEYRKYRKHWASLLMGGLLLKSFNGVRVRKFSLNALSIYFDIFPENIQFLSMIIAPKLIANTSASLRRFKQFF